MSRIEAASQSPRDCEYSWRRDTHRSTYMGTTNYCLRAITSANKLIVARTALPMWEYSQRSRSAIQQSLPRSSAARAAAKNLAPTPVSVLSLSQTLFTG